MIALAGGAPGLDSPAETNPHSWVTEPDMDSDFRIGQCWVRPRAASIEHSGRRHRVDRMAMKVLTFLVERAGREVSREAIFDAVWEGRAISDEALTVAISTLRKALGDDARAPEYIETIPKYGYRIIAPISVGEDVQGSPGRPTAAPPTPLPQPTPLRRPRVLAWTIGLAITVAAGGLWLAGGSSVRALRDGGGTGSGGSPRAGLSAMPVDSVAYEAYMRGSYLLSTGSVGALKRSIPEFEDAIRHEPEFAPAHAALAEAHVELAARGAVPARPAFENGREALETASYIGGESARLHALRGLILYAYEWDFDAAEREFRRAIDLDPRDSKAREWYARYLTVNGRFEEAIRQVELQRELDPPSYSRPQAASIYNMSRRHEAALRELREQIELEPESIELRFELLQTYVHLGQLSRALAQIDNFPSLGCATPEQLRELLSQDSGAGGLCRLKIAWLDDAGQRGTPVSAMEYAEAYAGAGDPERAFEWLERAYEQREPALLGIGVDPSFDGVRSDPRFARLVDRVGLPF